jgi:spectinomycin phosphotransferase
VAKLQNQYLEYVLCHADIHGWNIIVDKEDSIYVVDWDTLVFAPKERDLMFIGAGIWDSGRTPEEDNRLFYYGYGKSDTNQDATCYYRLERIIQDIAEYCKLIFVSNEGGDDRIKCFEHLQLLFLPNSAIERAYDYFNTRKIL